MKTAISLILLCRLVLAGIVLAAVALPLRAANLPAPVRLFEISVVKFLTVDGQSRLHEGHLLASGGFRLAHNHATNTQAPAQYQGKTLIFTEAWHAFKSLSADAVANFELRSEPISIAGLVYYEVGIREDTQLNVGKLINLSARGLVTESEPMIAGFVIDESHRRVLIRALGPALIPSGVPNALADPYLRIYKGNLSYYFNGNWSERHDAAEIVKVTPRVGASPLPEGSKDAVLLVELPPGIYTAHVQPETGSGGVAILEIYSVPE